MQKIVYPHGNDEIEITATQKVAIATYGDGKATVYKKIVNTNQPPTWTLYATVDNQEKVLNPGVACTLRIEAGVDQVKYAVGSAPVAVEFAPPVPGAAHVYFNDFDHFAAADWTITTTEAGAGSATEALGDADGGVLVITNDAADDDADFFQKVGESFKFVAGKKLWFESRFKVSDATQSDVVMGLQITDTTPLDVTDGVFFIKADGDPTISLRVEKNNTGTATEITDLADDTYVTLGYYYDGDATIYAYVNRVQVATSVTTNLVDDEELTISFGIQNGEAVAKIMTIDYIMVAKER